MPDTLAHPIDLNDKQWQRDLAAAVSDPLQLLSMLDLSPADFKDPIGARTLFPMRVPQPFIAKMKQGDVKDPLLLQVLPAVDEFDKTPGYTHDPLSEQQNQQPGLLHKYKSRVLVIFRSGCAVNCRYCFRRHFPYQDNNINKARLLEIIRYLQTQPQINEVILSGGDPLMATDAHIQWFMQQLEALPHITRFRIHSRLPVVIPNRLTEQLADLLGNSRLNCVMVLHINHSNEIDDTLKYKLAAYKANGVTLLNQAVLLKDINDSLESQVQLSEKLFDAGILPYYLHVLDKVEGAAHFDVSEEKAKLLIDKMLVELPGFLMPKLVREIADRPSKTPII